MPRMTTTAATTAALALALTACGGDAGPGPTEGSGNSTTWATPSTSGDDTAGGSSSPSVGDSSSKTSTSDGSGSSTSSSGDASSSSASPSSSTNTGKPFDADEFTAKLKKSVEENPTVSIEVSATLEGQQGVSATGVQDLANDSLDMEVDMGGQQLGYRLVDGQYYLAQPPKWVPVTEDTTNPLIKETLEQIQLLSMRRQFDAFVAGVEKAGDKGTDEVDGVKTRHYTATVNTDRAYEELGTKKDPGAPDTLVYDVWLDEDDLIRQMTFTQDGAEATLTAKDWGEPVDIAEPKDSEITQAN